MEIDEPTRKTVEMDEPLQKTVEMEKGDSRGDSKAWPAAGITLTNQVSTYELFISFSMDQLVC